MATRDPPEGTAVDALSVGDEVWFATSSADGSPMEVEVTIVEFHEGESDDEGVTVRRVGQQSDERAAMSTLRPKGFNDQTLRRWGSEEVVRREDARRLRDPPPGHAEGIVGAVRARELHRGRCAGTHFLTS